VKHNDDARVTYVGLFIPYSDIDWNWSIPFTAVPKRNGLTFCAHSHMDIWSKREDGYLLITDLREHLTQLVTSSFFESQRPQGLSDYMKVFSESEFFKLSELHDEFKDPDGWRANDIIKRAEWDTLGAVQLFIVIDGHGTRAISRFFLRHFPLVLVTHSDFLEEEDWSFVSRSV
jgi:hypothetical protein